MRYRLIILMAILLLLGLPASAEEASYKSTVAEAVGFSAPASLFDANRATFTASKEENKIILRNEQGLYHLYLEFDRLPERWKMKNPATGKTAEGGKEGFLHEYVDLFALLGEAPKELEMTFSKETVLADVYGFGEGELPSFVQKWSAPCKEADLMLLSSHSDDEQLFFAGVLPYYAIERRLQVQVVYIVQHFEAGGVKDHTRPHEQLDGLWTVGVRNYPVMSDFPDVYSESKNRAVAFEAAKQAFGREGVTYDDFCGYITSCIRRFKPLVIVSHDLNGEYGHGTHVFCASALTDAIGFATDASQYPESAAQFGTWQVEKTYLHLYDQNPILMDWDIPLESLGGKTPFQITQEGFGCHKSQHWTWFNRWIYGRNQEITKASQIATYSPCRYGLYQTQVGADIAGGDFFEHVITYRQRAEKAEQEAKEKAEQERIAQLEEEKRMAQEQAKIRRNRMTLGCGIGAAVLLAAFMVLLLIRKRRNKE